jgi:hypothetical protein
MRLSSSGRSIALDAGSPHMLEQAQTHLLGLTFAGRQEKEFVFRELPDVGHGRDLLVLIGLDQIDDRLALGR